MNLKEKLVAKKEKAKEWYSKNQEEIKTVGCIALKGTAYIAGIVIGMKLYNRPQVIECTVMEETKDEPDI